MVETSKLVVDEVVARVVVAKGMIGCRSSYRSIVSGIQYRAYNCGIGGELSGTVP